MTDPSINDKVDEILAAYVVAEEAGEPVSRENLLTQHPDLADELKGFFADRDQFKRLASPLSAEAARRNDLPARVRYFGDYELLEEVAQGGMGVVYKARQTSLNRIVAVKMVLAGHLATDADVQRFADEAETAASLKHKAIVPIHEVGHQNGQHYFSMDFIEGRNLAEVIRADPPSPEEAAQIVKAIAEAVDYAHGEGIVHRDIKPSNILIDASGQVHITDFGLAMRVEGDSELTQTGQVMGTPSYMSPEQAQAKRDLVGPASDIYSLGAILYEMLTGRPPFRGETAVETIQQVIDTVPLSPRRLNPRSPRDLETVCLKCLEKEPHKRYETAVLLADDVGRYLAGETILARPVGHIERMVRWCRREPLVSGLAASVLILLTFLAISGPIAAVYQGELRRRAETLVDEKDGLLLQNLQLITQLELSAAEQRAAATESRQQADLARRRGFNAQLRRVEQLWRSDPSSALSLLKDESNCPKSLRDFTWRLLLDRARRKPKSITIPSRSHLDPCTALSPDGGLVASVDNAKITLWRTDTLTEYAEITGNFAAVKSIEFSPNGQWLAFGDGKELVIWSVDDKQAYKRLPGHNANIVCIGFSRDGELLASGAVAEVRLWRINMEWDSIELSGHTHIVDDVDFSPTGNVLATASFDETIRLWNVETGAQQAVLNEQPRDAWVRQALFDSDSTRLWQFGKTGLVEWDLDTGQHRGGEGVWDMYSSPREGARVGSMIALNLNEVIIIWDPVFGEVRSTWRSTDGFFYGMSVSANATTLAAVDNDKLCLWNLKSRQESLVIDLERHDLQAIAFSEDNAMIVTVSDRWEKTRVWDAASGKQMKKLLGQVRVGVIDVIDTSTGRTVSEVEHSPPGTTSQRGKPYVANLSDKIEVRLTGNVIEVWERHPHAKVTTLKGHTDRVITVALSSDGRTIASSGWDHTVRLWDPVTGDERAVLEGRHTAEVIQIVFSPDGSMLASASADGTVKVWKADMTD